MPPASPGPNPAEVEACLHDVLSRDARTLSEEAGNLEEAYRILNDALA